MQIGQKAPPPPPHFCLLVRYSACIEEHDVTSRTDISCIIEPHIGCDLAEKPPLPPSPTQFIQIHSTLVQLAEKPPPRKMRENFLTRSIHFRQFRATLVFVAEKPPPKDGGNFFDLRSIHFRQF